MKFLLIKGPFLENSQDPEFNKIIKLTKIQRTKDRELSEKQWGGYIYQMKTRQIILGTVFLIN